MNAPLLTLPAAAALACPACQAPLAPHGQSLACAACGQCWSNAGGVANFGEAPTFPQDFSAEQTAALLEVAASAGWQAALHDHMRPLDAQIYRHAVDEYRAQWRCLLPARPQARVLDLRCGWGPVTVGLAEDYGEVVAADTAVDLARFTALRAKDAGATNVQAVSLDPRRGWPLATAYFDVVVLQSALEWSEDDALLREAARVLVPGGSLFLHVPNRLNAARLLQCLQARLRGGLRAPAAATARPRTLWGYRRALARAGFAPPQEFALLPSVGEPFYIVPLDGRGALRFFLDNLFNDASLHAALAERHLLAPYRLARVLWQGLRLLPVEPVLRHCLPGYGLLATRR